MTRDAYIEQLSLMLSFLDEDARAAALTFYAEMLDDRIEDGMEEEEAVAAMDSVEEIAARLQKETKKEGGNGPLNEEFFTNLAGHVRGVVEDAIQGAGDLFKNANTVVNAAAGRAEDAFKAFRDEIKKNEEGGYDQHVFTCPAEEIHAISISAQDLPIRIFPGMDEQLTLTYYSCAEDPYTVSVQDGTLTLSHTGDGLKKGFRFSRFNFGSVKMLWNQSSPTIELAIPADMLCDLSARTSNASLQVSSLQALCDTQLSTSNGRIAAEDLRCKSLTLQTSNARLSLTNVTSKTHLNGKTSNGRIEADSVHSQQEMQLTTSNGAIHASALSTQSPLSLITSNGTIEVSSLNAPQITLRTSNGGIRGTLPGPMSDWQIQSKTTNGRNSLSDRTEGNRSLAANTSNGNISLEFIG